MRQAVDSLGNVRGKLDYLIDFAVFIENGVVGGFQLNGLAVGITPGKFTGKVFPLGQLLPKVRVLLVKAIKAELPVVLTLYLFKIDTENPQKVFIGVGNVAIRGKFDHRQGFINSGKMALRSCNAR